MDTNNHLMNHVTAAARFKKLPSLHLFTENPFDERSYTDLDFIQNHQGSRRDLLEMAIETISPAAAPKPASSDNEAVGLEFLEKSLFELSTVATCNLILFNSPVNESLTFEMIYRFAQRQNPQKKILIIDCNLRQSDLDECDPETSEKAGLGEYLAGKRGVEEILFRTNLENVSFIGSGAPVENPVRTFMSNRFLQLLALLRRQFDLVLLNTLPYRESIDTFVLAKFLRPIIVLVLQAGREDWQSIADIRKELAVLDLKILGLIDNR